MAADLGQRLGEPVDERFAPNETDLGLRARRCDKMFRPAKTDFEPDFADRLRKQYSQIADRPLGQAQARQQRLDQLLLPWPQPLANAPAEKGASAEIRRVAVLVAIDVRGGHGEKILRALRPENAAGRSFWPRPAAKVKRALAQASAFFSASTRSVFSQEKLPSRPGLRPKWP